MFAPLYLTVAPFALGLQLGGMILFSFLVAPTAFGVLKEPDAARFVRAFFPRYYVFVLATALLATVAMVGANPELAMLMLAVAGLALLSRNVLTPRINALRDRQLAGDAAAGRWFGRMHGLSVGLNLAMMLAAAAALVIHG